MERRDYLDTGAVLPLHTPVGAKVGGVQPLGLSPGADGDGGAGGEGGEGQAGEEGVGQPSGLLSVVSPALLRGQAGGARGRALQTSSTLSQDVADTPGVSDPGAAVDSDSGQVESGAGLRQFLPAVCEA